MGHLPLHALIGWAAMAASGWTDPGRPDSGRGPVAVVIPQPGLRALAYTSLVEHLEAGGLDVLQVRLPLSPEALHNDLLPDLTAALSGRPIIVVGHGYGGRSAAQWAPLSESVCGLALLGSPLVVRPTAWPSPLPDPSAHPDGLSLRRARRSETAPTVWPLVRTASEIPTPWLGRLSAEWLAEMTLAAEHPVAPPESLPTWIAVAPLDELAPPETTGTLSPSVRMTRWGMLRGWRTDATTADLLTDPRPAAHLARWARQTCA